MKNLAKLVVMISGSGTNLQAIIDACESGKLPAKIVGVVSNKPDAYGIQRAEKHHIPVVVFPKNWTRAEYDDHLSSLIKNCFQPDWVILAGWMRILTMNFLGKFPNRVINLHPALPGMFPGIHAIERAYNAAQEGEISETGVMVHLVPDERVDEGPVLAQETVPIHPDDSLDDLEERIHKVEHRLLVDTIHQVITENQT